jgi:hypothetical protein
MIGRIAAAMQGAGPVRAAFLGSLLLSLAAVQGHLINRDGIYYLETARAILDSGLAAGLENGEWAFLPVLIAALSGSTGLTTEMAAHCLNALLMAGACSLLVAWVRERTPEDAWAACLVVLAMPAFNQYRHEILREFGFWFFSLLGLWLAMRWEETQRRPLAVASQAALALAVLFRLEAAVFFAALMLWQAMAAPAGDKARRVLTIGALPLAGGLLAILLFGTGWLKPPARLLYYLDVANPLHIGQAIGEAASRMSEAVFKHKYSREEAGYVFFFGLLSIIPVKFLQLAGVFLVPLAYRFFRPPGRRVAGALAAAAMGPAGLFAGAGSLRHLPVLPGRALRQHAALAACAAGRRRAGPAVAALSTLEGPDHRARAGNDGGECGIALAAQDPHRRGRALAGRQRCRPQPGRHRQRTHRPLCRLAGQGQRDPAERAACAGAGGTAARPGRHRGAAQGCPGRSVAR